MELSQIIKTLSKDVINQSVPADIHVGTVTSEEPLEITIDNGKILNYKLLTLSRNVTDFTSYLSFDNPDIKQKTILYDKAEKESKEEPLPEVIEFWQEPHKPRDDDKPPPEIEKTIDIKFAKKWYENTLELEDENGELPEKLELPAYHEITIYNRLREKERVILSKTSGGQMYFVIDRIGDFTNKQKFGKNKTSKN